MNIEDPNFTRRKVLQKNNLQQYSPKKRWDEDVFGSERKLLADYVQSTLKDHQNDGDILQKFKKQADELKEKKRRQKFPYLFQSKQPQSQKPNLISTESETKIELPYEPVQNRKDISDAQSQQTKQLFKFYHPKLIDFETQLQTRLQYERMLFQKDLQLYKRQEKIKKQKKQIKKLYSQLKIKHNQDELDKYIESQSSIRDINRVLIDIKQEISSQKSLLSQLNKAKSSELYALTDPKPNKSQLLLSNFNHNSQLSQRIQNNQPYLGSQVNKIFLTNPEDSSEKILLKKEILNQNPQIAYSSSIQKNRSNVFQNIPLFNSPKIKRHYQRAI